MTWSVQIAEAFQEWLDVTGNLERGVSKALVFCDKTVCPAFIRV